jgi:hypothetical protein
MATPSGGDERPEQQAPRMPSQAARRVRRHAVGEEPPGRWDIPDSERDEIWGDVAPDRSDQLRRDVPPHHGA